MQDERAANVKAGGGRQPGLSVLFSRITAAMNAVGTVWIFALMVLINADIFGRGLFNAPVRGTTEIVSLSIVGIVFLQLAHTLWAGRLTRSEALLDVMARRAPRLRAAMLALFSLTGTVLMIVIVYASIPYLERALAIDEYVGAQGDFTAPTWPVRLIILIGCSAAAVQFLLMGLGHLRDLRPGFDGKSE